MEKELSLFFIYCIKLERKSESSFSHSFLTVFSSLVMQWISSFILLQVCYEKKKKKKKKMPTRCWFFSSGCHICKYSQTCSNDHFYKIPTRLRRTMLSPTNRIAMQSLLYKTSTCLTRPATTFLPPKWKKKPL